MSTHDQRGGHLPATLRDGDFLVLRFASEFWADETVIVTRVDAESVRVRSPRKPFDRFERFDRVTGWEIGAGGRPARVCLPAGA